MQMRDYRCLKCGHEIEILHREGRTDPRLLKCASCGFQGFLSDCPSAEGLPYEQIVKQTSRVIPDDVPGGFFIENLDKIPRWFPSKSAFHTELAARGLTTERGNQWRGDPGNGSDKPRNGLSRWVGLPPSLTQADEDARIRAWHDHEEDLLASAIREKA